jgi:predicted NAD/FAD-binding protein
VAVAFGGAISAQGTPSRTAVASLSKPCPDTSHTVGSTTYSHNSFEADSSLIASSQKWSAFQGSGVYPPSGSWAWSFGSNGIAGEDSDYGAENGPAPDGDFVAFLQWDGSTTPYFEFHATLPGGT